MLVDGFAISILQLLKSEESFLRADLKASPRTLIFHICAQRIL